MRACYRDCFGEQHHFVENTSNLVLPVQLCVLLESVKIFRDRYALPHRISSFARAFEAVIVQTVPLIAAIKWTF